MQTSPSLQKLFTPRETTKMAYQDSDDFTGIDITAPVKPVELVKPLSKEQAHALWAITTIPEKKAAILEALESLTFMNHSKTIDRITKTKKLEHLDMTIADILLYSEEQAETVNKKRLEKANPFYVAD
jgi:hypothetical protein